MPKQTRDAITQMAGSPPALLQAADYGHVHRARLYWGHHIQVLKDSQRDAFIDVHLLGHPAADSYVIRWHGPCVPQSWQPDPPFQRKGIGHCYAPTCPGSDCSRMHYPN
eukprot:888697-Amphidinium_carterae.1